MGKRNVCAITGTSGYVGGSIKDYFIEQGWTVYELTRNAQRLSAENTLAVRYSLQDPISREILGILRDCDLLVHCAYDFRTIAWKSIRDVNIDGAVRLLKATKQAGVKKTIVISTMSAFEGCKSLYGRAKLEIEKEALWHGAVVVRPGLVFGSNPGGMVGILTRLVTLTRIIPLIGGGKQTLYLAHEEDLNTLIHNIATSENVRPSGPIIAACERGRTLRQILEAVAEAEGRRVLFFPIDWRLASAALKVMEKLPIPIGLRSDSIVSLMNLETKPNFESASEFGASFREFRGSDIVA